METLLPDMFVPDEAHILYSGAVSSTDGQCLDKMGERAGGTAGIYFCHGQGSNQAWLYSTKHEIRSGSDDMCLDGAPVSLPGEVKMYK